MAAAGRYHSDNEDAGGATGWSIANTFDNKTPRIHGSPVTRALRITIKGTIDPATNNAPMGEPTISGTARVGRTLTASTTGITDADGLTSPTYTYQWIRANGTDADIASANSSTYTLVDADLGKTIKVKVSFTDDASNTETLTSAAYPSSGTVQANNVLVSNVGQTQSSIFSLATFDLAQSFRTGANATGYTLTSIELRLDSTNSTNTPAVKLYSGSANGTLKATFTGPAMLDASSVKNYAFTPSSAVILPRSTTYWVVVEGATDWTYTLSTGEDGTSAVGWSIGDNSEYRNEDSTGNFLPDTGNPFLIHVTGTLGGIATTGICSRALAVQTPILAATSRTACADVTTADLASVTTLSVMAYGSTSIDPADFAGLTGLTSLWISASPQLTTVPDNAFAGLTALTTLNFNVLSSLTTLGEDAFAGLTTLENLNLSVNLLTTLHADIFDGLTALGRLELQDNLLTTLDEDIFDGLTALNSLELNNNRSLAALDADIFDGLTALEYLDLSSTNQTALDADIFDDLTALKTLYLSGNSLTTLDADIFDGLTALETLVLNINSLTTLDADIFDGLTALDTLALNNNSLTTLDADIFDGLTALIKLYLNSNLLTTLDADLFDGLTALYDLRLDQNSLSTLDADIFDGLTALGYLELQDNRLTALDADIFDGITLLERLDLECNYFTALDLDIFNPFAATLTHLDLMSDSFTTPPVDIGYPSQVPHDHGRAHRRDAVLESDGLAHVVDGHRRRHRHVYGGTAGAALRQRDGGHQFRQLGRDGGSSRPPDLHGFQLGHSSDGDRLGGAGHRRCGRVGDADTRPERQTTTPEQHFADGHRHGRRGRRSTVTDDDDPRGNPGDSNAGRELDYRTLAAPASAQAFTTGAAGATLRVEINYADGRQSRNGRLLHDRQLRLSDFAARPSAPVTRFASYAGPIPPVRRSLQTRPTPSRRLITRTALRYEHGNLNTARGDLQRDRLGQRRLRHRRRRRGLDYEQRRCLEQYRSQATTSERIEIDAAGMHGDGNHHECHGLRQLRSPLIAIEGRSRPTPPRRWRPRSWTTASRAGRRRRARRSRWLRVSRPTRSRMRRATR